MANQIQSCFRRYEKKYRLTAAQQRLPVLRQQSGEDIEVPMEEQQ